MAEINTKTLRNIALLGHSGSGKTSFAEALLYTAKAIDRLGKISDGNTVCDFDAEEIKRKFSISLSAVNLTWNDTKINLLDTPGFLDFEGEAKEAVRISDAAIITVDAKAGLEAGTELAWDYASDAGIPRIFFINKYDDPEANFERVFAELKAKFGINVCPVFIPIKKDGEFRIIDLIELKAYAYDEKGNRTAHELREDYTAIAQSYMDSLNEAVAETSEELLDKYFAGETITKEEKIEALHQGIITGTIVPVYCGSASKMWGIRAMLDTISASFPRFTARKYEKIILNGEKSDRVIEPDGECAVFIFKTVSDQFGKQSYFKVMNGKLTKDKVLINSRTGEQEKFSHIYTMRGKKQTETDFLCCGDIGVILKLGGSATCDTLSDTGNLKYCAIDFPNSYMCMAIEAAGKGDEDKISNGISKLLEEDSTIHFENNPETKQQLIYGMGPIHLDIIISKLKSRYGVSASLTEAHIPYRETIKGRVQAEGKHKKQSGGSGQYGHVKITFSHGEEEGLTFTTSVVGGSVPKGYFPAVEKGLTEAMQRGVLAGYPVVNLAADLFDGSYHDVDSNEISFKLAARLAYKNGLIKANPILLEPVGELKVNVPDTLVGDVIGDLNKRRGRVTGMNPYEKKNGYTVIEAEVPKAEMSDYVISLRAMSQGRGRFEFTFARYEEVPGMIADKIIKEAKTETD